MSSNNQKQPRQKVTRDSKCLCGDVEFAITGVDRGAALCHCDNCRRSSGSAFMHNHRFVESEVEIKKGKGNIKMFEDKNTKSGNIIQRHFCSNCGSPLYLKPLAFSGLTIVHESVMDGDRVQASLEMFPENKYSWTQNLVPQKSKM